jgi:hypothetical protein
MQDAIKGVVKKAKDTLDTFWNLRQIANTMVEKLITIADTSYAIM